VVAVRELLDKTWDPAVLTRHAARFSEARFIARMQEIAAEELGDAIN